MRMCCQGQSSTEPPQGGTGVRRHPGQAQEVAREVLHRARRAVIRCPCSVCCVAGLGALALIAIGQEDCAVPCPEEPVEDLNEGGGLRRVTASGFELEMTELSSDYDTAIQALSRILPMVSAADLAADLNREGTQVFSTSLPRVEQFHVGFRWNEGDFGVTYWIPQGITGSADAYDSALFGDGKFLLVSWHYDADAGGTSYDKGVRVSFADVTDMNDVHYRHVLLVEPFQDGDTPNFRAVPIHAGGMAWYGDNLYVADTSYGLRVFDVRSIMQVTTGRKDLIGYNTADDHYYAFDYKYVLPQVNAWYMAGDSCDARFSFVSLDRSTSPHSLLSGEYVSDAIDGRLLRWKLDEATQEMVTDASGTVVATEAFQAGQTRIQGALSFSNRYWLSCSSQEGAYGVLYRTGEDTPSVGYDWVDGPEDLHYAPTSDNLWTATEDVGDRYVFAVKLTDYDSSRQRTMIAAP